MSESLFDKEPRPQGSDRKPEPIKRMERCSFCGALVADWVDPDWADGRICRTCETKNQPASERPNPVPNDVVDDRRFCAICKRSTGSQFILYTSPNGKNICVHCYKKLPTPTAPMPFETRVVHESEASRVTLIILPAEIKEQLVVRSTAADHGPELLADPACDCCPPPATECAHDPEIICESCGEIMERSTPHYCKQQFLPIDAPSADEVERDARVLPQVKRMRAIERAAKVAVQRYSEIIDAENDSAFEEAMIDLARALAEGHP